MNRKNLNQIFDADIQQFEALNDSCKDESYKWNTIVEFQKVFSSWSHQ